MNTGFVRLAKLQQYLPFTVLKLVSGEANEVSGAEVATVLTVYGIETGVCCLEYS